MSIQNKDRVIAAWEGADADFRGRCEFLSAAKRRPYKTAAGPLNLIGHVELTWDGWLLKDQSAHLAVLPYDNDFWVHMQSVWTGCDDSTLPALYREDIRFVCGARVIRLSDLRSLVNHRDICAALYMGWLEKASSSAIVVNPSDLAAAWKDYENDDPIAKSSVFRGPAYVYLMHDPDAHRYKIGVSTDPEQRLVGVQAAAGAKNLYLVATNRGAYRDEQADHKAFAHRKLIGEWFEECDEIAEWARNGLVLPGLDPGPDLLMPIHTPIELIDPEFYAAYKGAILAAPVSQAVQ